MSTAVNCTCNLWRNPPKEWRLLWDPSTFQEACAVWGMWILIWGPAWDYYVPHLYKSPGTDYWQYYKPHLPSYKHLVDGWRVKSKLRSDRPPLDSFYLHCSIFSTVFHLPPPWETLWQQSKQALWSWQLTDTPRVSPSVEFWTWTVTASICEWTVVDADELNKPNWVLITLNLKHSLCLIFYWSFPTKWWTHANLMTLWQINKRQCA